MTVKVKAPCAGKLNDEVSLFTLRRQSDHSGEFLSRMSELAGKGRAISLEKGDSVLALFEDGNFMRVRVLSGSHIRERCYIATESLKP